MVPGGREIVSKRLDRLAESRVRFEADDPAWREHGFALSAWQVAAIVFLVLAGASLWG